MRYSPAYPKRLAKLDGAFVNRSTKKGAPWQGPRGPADSALCYTGLRRGEHPGKTAKSDAHEWPVVESNEP